MTVALPDHLSRDDLLAASQEITARPDLPITTILQQFRVASLGLPWDVAGVLVEPADGARIPVGPDGRRVGLFLQHGGEGDHRAMVPRAQFLAAKFGYRVFCFTMPGKFNFDDPSRDWPGDTINADGTARTPKWTVDSPITADQYELISDRSDPARRAKWGTLFFLRARPGTEFAARMAAWPGAFDDTMRAACARFFPPGDFSVYLHGHSTGGPLMHNLLQRVENVAGLVGMETSPFGCLFSAMLGMTWPYPYTDLTIRTWRHIAKYTGAEAAPEDLRRLPWLMEDVFDAWDRAKGRPQFKAEYVVTYGMADTLEAGARATAHRLGLDPGDEEALVQRFRGYAAPLQGPGTRPVPPLLYGIAKGSRDHTEQRYTEVVLPGLAALDRPPRTHLTRFDGGVHSYTKPEPGLPFGLLPAVGKLWDQAIRSGFYLV
jgi:hypothetical protein